MERRFSPGSRLAIKRASDSAPPVIRGYAAVFYRPPADPAAADDAPNPTQYQLWEDTYERIMPTAFDRALREQQDVRGLFNHDEGCVLGRLPAGTLRLGADTTGLWYEIDPPDTSLGRDLVVSLERGDVSGSSFAFVCRNVVWRYQDDLTIRELHDVDLYDVGPVTYPAYAGTDAAVRGTAAASGAPLAEVRVEHAAWLLAGKLERLARRATELEAD